MKLLLSLSFLCACGNAFGAVPSGAPTLQNLAGGRAEGMAEAFSTVVNDITAWQYNPASLSTLSSPQLGTSFSRGLASDYYSAFTYAHPTSAGTFAGSFGYYDAGEEKLLASDGAEFNVHLQRDTLSSISYANRTGIFGFGATAKVLHSELAESASATAFSMDAGGVLRLPSPGLAFGLALRNMGRGMKFIEKRDPLPLELRPGASWSFRLKDTESHFLLSTDAPYQVNEGVMSLNLGAEYSYHDTVSLRFGYHLNSDALGMTFGVGLAVGKLNFDYGYGATDGLEDIHRITVGYRF